MNNKLIKVIAETAWHHEGDFTFMKSLVKRICASSADIVKLHITLDLDEYMSKDHENYAMQKPWLLNEIQWDELIKIIRKSKKELLLLLNDTKAIKFASKYDPEYVELHSVCLNVPRLNDAILKYTSNSTIVIGVGGSTIDEINEALKTFSLRKIILMFGFQNYPTKLENINLHKVRKIQRLFPHCEFGYADHTAWNHPDNQLISLLGAANGMSYIEKHVTNNYGEERCDFSAAISFDMFENICKKINILNLILGDGDLALNEGELNYSSNGPMKLAPCATKNIDIGSNLKESDFDFIRTSQVGNITQIQSKFFIGKRLTHSVKEGAILKTNYFE